MVRCLVELKILLTLLLNPVKRRLWQPVKNETECSILCGLPSLHQYYLILVLSGFTDHSPFTSNNVRS